MKHREKHLEHREKAGGSGQKGAGRNDGVKYFYLKCHFFSKRRAFFFKKRARMKKNCHYRKWCNVGAMPVQCRCNVGAG
jgi:hypothetical protein